MTILHTSKNDQTQRLSRLKNQQQSCTNLLIECVKIMETHPEYTDRLTAVMSQVEAMMAQNSRLIARMEASLNSKI
ncbi:MAG: hypothetical protein JWP00_850 [Chloroflexi bacterium]|jgi:hypothetical protein|nr:hypothetical protein [Chloroflexota bacterium]